MIYTLEGKITKRGDNFVVVEAGGLGYQIFIPQNIAPSLIPVDGTAKFFCHYQQREDGVSLFGFPSEQELKIFGLLISVNGVGPKSAMAILSVGPLNNLLAAIKEGKAELLTRVSGIGRRTAERIILELKGKIQIFKSEKIVQAIESDSDIEDALVNLGYQRFEAREALKKIGASVSGIEKRLKAALGVIKESSQQKN